MLRLKLRDVRHKTRCTEQNEAVAPTQRLGRAPVVAGSLFFAFSFDEQLQKKGSEGIVIAELWFHLARLGTPAGTSYSGLLLLSQIAE